MNTTVIQALSKYNALSKADYTVIYFVYKKALYRVALDSIPQYMVTIKYSTRKSGHKAKLQLSLNNDIKRYILKYNNSVEYIGQVSTTLNNKSKYNRGYQVQRLEGKRQGDRVYKQYDSVPFYEGGDITDTNGKQIQVKFENAQIVMLNTLARL